MRNLFLIVWIGIHFFISPTLAQDEHNFSVKPQYTNCDSLPDQILDSSDPLSLIYSSRFRFTQNFNIPGSYGVRQGNYFSCDNQTGYLILVVGGTTSLFLEVPTEVWTGFIQSGDPDSYYQEKIKEKFQVIPNLSSR